MITLLAFVTLGGAVGACASGSHGVLRKKRGRSPKEGRVTRSISSRASEHQPSAGALMMMNIPISVCSLCFCICMAYCVCGLHLLLVCANCNAWAVCLVCIYLFAAFFTCISMIVP